MLICSKDFLITDGSLISTGIAAKGPSAPSRNAVIPQFNQSGDGVNLLIYPYDRLKVVSSDPVTGIDVTKREVLPFSSGDII